MTDYLRVKPEGLIRDLPPEEAGNAWTGGQNVVFEDEAVVKAAGFDKVFGVPLGAPQFLLAVIAPLQRYWIYAHANGVGVTDGVTHWDITPPAWLNGNWSIEDWTGATLNGLPVLNNGSGAPHWWDWDTSNAMQPLPDWPAGVTCKIIRDFKYHLVALNIVDNSVEFPNKFLWSSAAEPGAVPDSWTPQPGNDAGDNILAATPGEITDAWPLRDTLMIYKQHSAFRLSFVGGNFVFDTRKKFAAVGALTANCVCEYKGSNLVLADGDVVVTDGHDYTSLVDRRIRNEIFKSIDPDNYQRAQVIHDKANNAVWVCWAETGSQYLNRAAVWDTVKDQWGLISLPGVAHIGAGLIGTEAESTIWDDDNEPWNQDLTVWNEQAYNPTSDGLLAAREGANDLVAAGLTTTGPDGEPISWQIEKASIDFGDSERVKTVGRVWPRVTGVAGDIVYVRVGAQMWRDDPIKWSNPYPFIIGFDDKVDVFATGRFVSVSMGSTNAGRVRVHGFDIEYEGKGKF